MTRPGALVLLSAGCIAVAPVHAQLPDPTRPAGASMTADGAGGGVPADSGVQAVVVRHRGKSAAVINGQYVEVGGKLGDKRVLKIGESEVVLLGATGREVIKVIPDVEKQPVRRKAAAKRRTTETKEK